MNFETLNKQRKFFLITAAIGIISVFLPWAGALGYTINGFHSYGIVVFLSFAAIVGLTMIGDQTKPLDNARWLAALLAGILALIFVALSLNNFSDLVGFGISFGIGIWLALLSAAASIACVWLFKIPCDTIQSGFENLKQKANAAPEPAGPAGKVAELEKLAKLKSQGKITDEEYELMKAKVL
jgi:hypothetical protein